MHTLESLTIQNFKSIREQSLVLGKLNVFIGGNGVGKSNLLGVFKLLHEVVNQNLARYTLEQGGADTFLYFGKKRSAYLDIALRFSGPTGVDGYDLRLLPTADDMLYISTESPIEQDHTNKSHLNIVMVAEPVKESLLRRPKEPVAKRIANHLEAFRVYHFNDTSGTAKVKNGCNVDDNQFLRPQAENLAAILYWIQEKHPNHLALIEDTIRQVAPFFDRFQLAPRKLDESQINLQWKEVGNDDFFNARALSDGTLRFICLVTLLLQPELPSIIILDEPELGLHPAAVGLLASILKSASETTQIVVATQSVTLVNQFGPEVVWAVDREGGQSVFKHLAQADMSGWLDDYSLGELWEKNQLGARP